MTFLIHSLRYALAWTLAAAIVVLVATASDGHTAPAGAVDYITFQQPVTVPDTELPPGEYLFEAVRPDLVRVWRRDTRQVLYTGFTQEVSRLAERERGFRITLGEAPAGRPAPVAHWFPSGRSRGHAFIYR